MGQMETPYLWRYREGDAFGEYIDILMVEEPSERFVEENPGELTIITWRDYDK